MNIKVIKFIQIILKENHFLKFQLFRKKKTKDYKALLFDFCPVTLIINEINKSPLTHRHLLLEQTLLRCPTGRERFSICQTWSRSALAPLQGASGHGTRIVTGHESRSSIPIFKGNSFPIYKYCKYYIKLFYTMLVCIYLFVCAYSCLFVRMIK